VVYKVDRLSRSLTDFSRLVEVFEAHKVSFVSVTQQFNTTHSMGRLTLNILLSFAQFEREIIGERIRDKVAAHKRKGKWTGGRPTKRVQTKVGQVLGGEPLSRSTLYRLLTSRIYLGEVSPATSPCAPQHRSSRIQRMPSLPIQPPIAEIADFCRRHGIARLSLFGSVLRQDFSPTSDIDVLVEFQAGRAPGFIGFAGLQMELSKILGRTVDLRTPADLSGYFRDEVLREARLLHAA